jgi:hypothetical protein
VKQESVNQYQPSDGESFMVLLLLGCFVVLMQMHAMRQEYQVFTLYQFRKFVNQEVDKEGKKEARFLKKQKKEAKKLKRRTGLSRAEQG